MLDASQERPGASEADAAFDSTLTAVLVVLALIIVPCGLYQSRASIDRVVMTSSLARRIRVHVFQMRPGGASDAEMDAFDEGVHTGTRMPRIHPVHDGTEL